MIRSAIERAADCEALPPVEGSWTQVDGLAVHARRIDGPAAGTAEVVLLHGLIVSGRYMLPLAAHLSARHTVHVPDLPGVGRSRATPIEPSAVRFADTLVAWLDERSIVRPHLVANSAGCAIAAAACARHPGAVRSLALVGPTMDPAAPHAHQQVLRWLRTGRHEPLGLNLVIARDFLDAGPRHALAMARHALSERIEPYLTGVDVPALVVRGTDDFIVSRPWAETVAALARAELVVIDGPHALNFARPRSLAAVLRPFFGSAERV